MWILLQFTSNYKLSPSQTIRKFKNGGSLVGSSSNRSFFNNHIVGGYWRYDILDNLIRYSMYIHLKDIKDIGQIRLRIRKLGLKITELQEVKNDKLIPSQYPYLYRSFGAYYWNN